MNERCDFYVYYAEECGYRQRGITCPNEYAWCETCSHERNRKLVIFSQMQVDPIRTFEISAFEYYGIEYYD